MRAPCGPTLDRLGGWERLLRPRALRMATWVGFATAILVAVLLPQPLHACAVCFDARDENRMAFIATTAFLSLLPLGMVAGAGLFIRKRVREIDEAEQETESSTDSWSAGDWS